VGFASCKPADALVFSFSTINTAETKVSISKVDGVTDIGLMINNNKEWYRPTKILLLLLVTLVYGIL